MSASSRGLVLQVETKGDIRGQSGRLKLVLRFALRNAVVCFRIDAGPRAPRVQIARAEHERRAALRVQSAIHGVGQLKRRGKLAELPELVVDEVARRRLVVRSVDGSAERLRDRGRLTVERRRRVLRVATRERTG